MNFSPAPLVLIPGNKKIPSSIQAKSVCGLVVKSIVAMKEIHYLFNSLDGPRVRFPANAIANFLSFFAVLREWSSHCITLLEIHNAEELMGKIRIDENWSSRLA